MVAPLEKGVQVIICTQHITGFLNYATTIRPLYHHTDTRVYLLFQLGAQIGAGTTIWLVIVTGFIGASMAKREGRAVLMQLQADAEKGSPADHLIEGLMVCRWFVVGHSGCRDRLCGLFTHSAPHPKNYLHPGFVPGPSSDLPAALSWGTSGNFRRPDGSFRHPDYPDVEIIDAPPQPKKGKDGPTSTTPHFRNRWNWQLISGWFGWTPQRVEPSTEPK